jgi:hypothetical protein
MNQQELSCAELDRLATVKEEIKDLNEEICQLLENKIQQNQSEIENRRLGRLDESAGGNI